MHQRSQLEIVNMTTPREKLRIVNAADIATIYLYDMIGGWDGVQAKDFVQALNSIDAKHINLRINSPGGSVFDGRAMATAIKEHPATVTAYIDGLAASAASWIAIAANSVVMAEGSFMMIHNAQAGVLGDRHSMLDMAGVLEQLDNSFIADYAAKTGKPAAELGTLMDAETWFSAQDAVDMGFADRVETGKQASNRWNLTAYRNAPQELLAPAPTPAPTNTQPAAPDRRALAEKRLALLERLAA
jgi:ATP-dependent protease ClpP protease subunit